MQGAAQALGFGAGEIAVNMGKLESYMVDGNFASTEFYAEIEGHPEDKPVKLAFEELHFYSETVRMVGIFPAHPYRKEAGALAQ